MAEGTITLGRSKRSTAGNRMRELLEKAHQQDDDDLFKEEEDDEEFAEPTEVRDVYLDEFADTDDEAEDEEAEEREIRREERRRAKGKGRAVFDPLAGQPKPKKAKIPQLIAGSSPSSSSQAEALSLLDPEIDPSTMAPSTLILALRKKRREAKRQQRSEVRRSNLRASTLKTEAEIAEREVKEREAVRSSRKGRKAMHEGGEARGVRNLSQAELIAEALEEEERNKEELRKWLRREEERRELRRVGRKRVRGPRWTWISRTVGKVVEVVENEGQVETRTVEASQAKTAQAGPGTTSKAQDTTTVPAGALAVDQHTTAPVAEGEQSKVDGTREADPAKESATANTSGIPEAATVTSPADQGPNAAGPSDKAAEPTDPDAEGTSINATAHPASNIDKTIPGPSSAAPASQSTMPDPAPTPMLQTTTTPNQPAEPSQYTRNYLVLSQVPGGLPAELALVLGDHVAWDQVQYIPSRARPINRRRPICPFTGKFAKYRHPATLIPYADVRGYQEIEAMLRNRYVWSEGGFWVGGEEDVSAEGVEEVEGWIEAVHGGWMAGFPIPLEDIYEEPVGLVEDEVEEVVVEEPEEVIEAVKGKKRGKAPKPAKGKKRQK